MLFIAIIMLCSIGQHNGQYDGRRGVDGSLSLVSLAMFGGLSS